MTTQNKGMKAMIFAAVLFGLLAISLAAATPTGPSVLFNVSSSKGSITNSARLVQAEAGNVSEVNITANSITKAWQGYFGNVTGTILLADSLGNNFYTWNNTNIRGEIYASRSSVVSWGTINCTNASNLTSENTYLGKLSTDPDSVNNTFTSTSHPNITVGTTTLSNCFSTQAYGNGGPTGANFWNVLLSDGNGIGNVVYTTFINKSTTSFQNGKTDFELLVGENGNSTSTAPTPYFFYAELD